jgi:hypothetical protein
MRPVTRGAQAPYAPVVDVTSQVNLDASLGAITITFGGVAKAKVKKVWGTTGPTALEVLGGLLLIAKLDKSKPAKPPKKKMKTITAADISPIKKTLASKLQTIYATAAGPLESQLGRFCSFCEIYQPSGVAVEHITPKSEFPLFYIAWANFLLACPVCNSIKKSKPPRGDAQFKPAPADEVGYFTVIGNNYLWPQKYTKVYRTTRPQLEYLGGDGKWWKVTYPVADGTELISADQMTRTIRADVCADLTTKGVTKPTWRMNVPVQVRVAGTNTRGTNMVDALVNLNKPSSNDKKPGGEADIRTWTRTKQWFDVLDSLTDLKKADAGTFPGLWKMMMKSVQQPGLYSVWVTLIDLLGPGGSWKVPGTTTPVMTKFLTEILDQNYFPGTDTDDTP